MKISRIGNKLVIMNRSIKKYTLQNYTNYMQLIIYNYKYISSALRLESKMD